MNKTTIGTICILAGLSYGSLAFDTVYKRTLGRLAENKWIKPPVTASSEANLLGGKPTIFLYSIGLIIIGIFILWNPNM